MFYVNKKVETIPFHNPKKLPQTKTEEKPLPADRQVKRKEINLSELKKALEESLAPLGTNDSEKEISKNNNKPLTGLEEKNLPEPIEAPKKIENKEPFDLAQDKPGDELNQQKTGIIKPGQTIKF
ncbi:MAG: hypothetical protein HYS02_00900 [Candidatus Staskawiczbacteria bacterium]|nr:hypothetical protein [Candidatus Staskawiczbacteria bacterium]